MIFLRKVKYRAIGYDVMINFAKTKEQLVHEVDDERLTYRKLRVMFPCQRLQYMSSLEGGPEGPEEHHSK